MPGSNAEHNPSRFPVIVYEGVSHMQFASGALPPAVKASDLAPEVSYEAAHAMMATSIANFLVYTLFPASSQAPAARVALLQEVQNTVRGMVACVCVCVCMDVCHTLS
jgi:hypothetical protein